MGYIFAIGLLLMPIIASTVACAVMWLLSFPFSYLLSSSGLNLGFLWFAALIVGIPASLFGAIICGPAISRTGLKPSTVAFCAAIGASLGLFFCLVVMGVLGSIRIGNPSQTADSKTIEWIFYTTAAVSGMFSGGIFAILAGLSVVPKARPN